MATYIRLTDYKSSDEKEQEFFNPDNRYEAKQEDFSKIPGSPIAYWISPKVAKLFEQAKKSVEYIHIKNGLSTGNNEKYIRYWFEVFQNNVGYKFIDREKAQDSNLKWFPCNKGGEERKWFGNNEYVLNWQNDGEELKDFGRLRNNGKHWSRYIYGLEYIFQKGLTYTYISSSIFGIRFSDIGFIPTNAGSGIFEKDNSTDNILYFLSLFSTKIIFSMLQLINPTIKFETGDISKLPIVFPKLKDIKVKIETLTQQNINISKEEWDSRETSWDFSTNPLLRVKSEKLKVKNYKIEEVYNRYCEYWAETHKTLHQNEEELNRLFIDIYELQDELTPDVELKDITILKNETKIEDGKLVFQADEIMKQFISYGVGVMFGRYSLDSDGLLIANMGQEIPSQAENDRGLAEKDGGVSFEIDDDNVIPVLSDDYFKDDIASRFVQFVKITFGEEDLSENIRFIENSLGTTLRKYFVKGFYEDHIKRYKKRPIYWMVASPKKGFMSLIYMHRYEADTFARVRNSYLTEYIAKLEAHKETLTLTTTSDTASDRDKKDADKQMKNIDTKLKEIIEFDRDKMMSWSQNPTEIDLDDGVKVNYCKFRDILYPITGLCK